MTTAERLNLLHRVANSEAFAARFEAAPVEAVLLPTSGPEPAKTGIADLVELILKRRDRLEQLIREPALQSVLLPKFLAIALIGFVFFGVALSLVFTSAGQWPRLIAIRDIVAGEADSLAAFDFVTTSASRLNLWIDGSAAALIAAYAIGLVAATGICLPSLYFYGLLAGVRMTMLDVVVQALKSKATAAVALVGILPIYAALGLAVVIFDLPDPLRYATLWLGLILPFLAGLFGTYSLYQGLAGFADTLPAERQCQRGCFLRRLVVSWAACYTAVTPVMIHSLWVLLAGT
jgi:hypothetical protein